MIILNQPEKPCINIVMTAPKKKGTYVQLRIRDEIKEDLQIAAEIEGLSMSAFIHQLIVKKISEIKRSEPRAFVLKAQPGPNTYNEIHEPKSNGQR